MGAFGPRRVVTKDGDALPPAPYQMARQRQHPSRSHRPGFHRPRRHRVSAMPWANPRIRTSGAWIPDIHFHRAVHHYLRRRNDRGGIRPKFLNRRKLRHFSLGAARGKFSASARQHGHQRRRSHVQRARPQHNFFSEWAPLPRFVFARVTPPLPGITKW